MNTYTEKRGFVSSFLGVAFEPSSAIEELFTEEAPPYSLPFLICLCCTIALPVIYQLAMFGMTTYRVDVMLSVAIIIAVTIGIFIIFESIFLAIVGISAPLPKLLAATAYATVPLTIALWLIYGFNYYYNGSLTLVTYLFSGHKSDVDPFLKILPYALWIVNLWVLLVFHYGLKTLSKMGELTSSFTTLMSLAPFYAALLISLYVGNLLRPGTFEIFLNVFTNPGTITYFGG